jgi:hypothetical protein
MVQSPSEREQSGSKLGKMRGERCEGQGEDREDGEAQNDEVAVVNGDYMRTNIGTSEDSRKRINGEVCE